MHLWLDDERTAPPRWIWARTYDEAVYFLSHISFVECSLDHDLGEEKTGYDFLCLLEARQNVGMHVPLKISVHSANPVGRQRMQQTIDVMWRRAGGEE